MSANAKLPQALMVDDDPMQREILTLALRKLGFSVTACATAREFVQNVKELKPRVMFVDLHVESVGVGFTVIKAIRSVLGREPKIFVISSDCDKASIAHALEIGANDYFVKPVTAASLGVKLSQYSESPTPVKHRPIPGGGSPAKLQIEMSVGEVDEFGLKLVGAHLPMKGTPIHLGGKFIEEITGKAQILVTVTSSAVESDSRQYSARADFAQDDEELLKNVRLWINQNTDSL